MAYRKVSKTYCEVSMTTFDRALYVSYIKNLCDELLLMETDDAFLNLSGNKDESLRYVICVEEQKRRENLRKYGDYEGKDAPSQVRAL